VLPDPDRVRRRPWWRRTLDVIVGEERRPSAPEFTPRPFGVALSPSGERVYVADPDARTVTRFEADGAASPLSCRDHPWVAPIAVALEPDGSLLVADAGAAALLRLGSGTCASLAPGEFERPTGVACSGNRIFVTDPPRHVVVALAVDGTLSARLGSGDPGGVEFRYPSALATATDGTLLVADSLNARVVRLSPDGAWMGQVGGPDVLRRPKGVATDGGGRVYVSDAEEDRVVVFAPGGALDYRIGENGAGDGQLAAPAGLAISGRWLAVADSLNGRVQVFEILGGGT
jgi:DNA-binding beta-propeller fold protein YncE